MNKLDITKEQLVKTIKTEDIPENNDESLKKKEDKQILKVEEKTVISWLGGTTVVLGLWLWCAPKPWATPTCHG